MDTFRRLSVAVLGILLGITTLQAQPRYDFSRLKVEHLDRGVVAVRQDDGRVFVSWRTLKSDRAGQSFDIYRNGQRLNASPLTTGGTCYVDDLPEGDHHDHDHEHEHHHDHEHEHEHDHEHEHHHDHEHEHEHDHDHEHEHEHDHDHDHHH